MEGGHEVDRDFPGCERGLGNRGMTVEVARQCGKDRKEWRALLNM